MKKALLNILLMILLGTSIFAQPSFDWVNTVGGSGTDYGHQTVIDQSGNIIVAGYFQDTVDFDPTVGVLTSISNGSNDFFVQKYDDNGNFLWAKAFGGISADGCRSVSCDANGNIYLTGIFSETVDFDPGPGVANYTANGSSDVYILKLDTNGNLVWIKVVGGPSSDGAYGITNDLNNNVIVTGIFANTVDFDPGVGTAIHSTTGASDIFTLKLDENGGFVWVRVVLGQSGSGNYGNTVTTDSNGNVITAGQFSSSSSDFDPGAGVTTLSSNGNLDVFIQKLDQNGNFLWVKSFGGTNADYVFGLDTDDLGNIITAGQFRSTVDFDTGAGLDERISVGSTDLFVHKLDALGNFIWVRTLGSTGGEDARSLATDSNGNIYVSGIFEGSLDFDPGTGTHIGTSQGNFDMFIQKFDGAGNFVWNNTYGGIGIDACYGCSVNSSGGIFLTGAFSSTVDFDSGSNVYNQTSNGERDIYVLKLQECVPISSTQSHTACSSYTWNGTTYNSTGTYTYTTTNAAGCDSTATLNLTIEDVTAPVANITTLSNVTSECSITTLTAPTATDNCAGTITGTHNATLPITSQGTTVVTWTYNDGNGNTSTQTQNVVIDDVTAPVANVASLPSITSECSVTSLTAPTATDNCTGAITGTHNATLPITSQGTTVVTWTYDDGNGNTSTQTQNVVIDDVTAPVANVTTLSNVTSECSVTTLTAPTATDNCAGTITGTHNATLPITSQGTTVVTWTYNDGNGNTSTQTQNVFIDDVTSPVADLNSLTDVLALCEVNNLNSPTATDNCVGSVSATHNVTLPLTVQGTTVVTWTFDDGNGNTSTQTQNVIISGPNVAVTQVDDITLTADLTGVDYQWIDCDNGNQILNGETNQTFVATSNGSYAVIVDNGNCSDTSTCVAITTVGLDENLSTELVKVYPNPTNGAFTIDLMEQNDQVSIRLINSLGQIIQEEHFELTDKINLNINSQPGIYFLEGQINQTQQFRINIIKQ